MVDICPKRAFFVRLSKKIVTIHKIILQFNQWELAKKEINKRK